jgi:hypothetical protein
MRKLILKGDNKMNKEIKKEIEGYVLKRLKHLNNLDINTDDYYGVTNGEVKNINILMELIQKDEINNNNLHLENRKIDISEVKNNNDTDVKNKELNVNIKRDLELRNDRIIKVLVDGATVIVPIIFYNVWMNRGFKFEETGTFTSNTFKNLFGKFKPTK